MVGARIFELSWFLFIFLTCTLSPIHGAIKKQSRRIRRSGPNVCGGQKCCSGWQPAAVGQGLCIQPICNFNCGTGICVQPNLCLCETGQYKPTCTQSGTELDVVIGSHDHVGHGRSEGERTMIDTFDTYVEDIFTHCDQMKESYPDIPVYLFGHSMGGSIAIVAACSKPEYFQAVVLSAPGIVVDPSVQPGAFKVFVARLMSRILPRVEIVPPLDPNVISSDPDQVEAYRTDPLVWHGGFKMKFATVFGDTMDRIKQLIPTIEWPFLVIHGDADKLTYIGGSQLLEKEAKSQDKEIKIYKGLKHEMLNEVKEEADKVKSDILEWLRKRIPC
ncbi:monoglyceride lipase-like [Paramuricea clavata]|uniref:Monoglyceride lipase-like n=1 Tax=Paramuricea clavata TaxID=317549 RepID=A0A7D9ILC4_PARCT|nr:monoglyceride lipase-like [Paramuricea clavata]